MYKLLRTFLFLLPAETSHDFALKSLKFLARTPLRRLLRTQVISDPVTLWGIEFPNRVGLAAGLDKNGDYIDAFATMGFGHIEIGTITPRPQPGNDKPRMFRLKGSRAIINRMGFNNRGVEALVANVKSSRFEGILGINIGKNFDTPIERAVDDYLICLEKVYPLADYITVNISSPNTPGLRDLQALEPLRELLSKLKAAQQRLADEHAKQVPLLVKVAPDLSEQEIADIALIIREQNIDGLIATNTTSGRNGVEKEPDKDEAGGLSGAPLLEHSTAALSKLNQATDGAIPIVGVGGIMDSDGAADKVTAGASLVQIYSGFIYQGPQLIADAARGAQRAAQQRTKPSSAVTVAVDSVDEVNHSVERVAVLGASNKPERYSNQAVRLLREHGHEVAPIHPSLETIEGLPVVASLGDVKVPIDTLTVYVRPELSETLIRDILELRPGRVIFNPGTESVLLSAELEKAGIPFEEACTLVLLRTGQFLKAASSFN